VSPYENTLPIGSDWRAGECSQVIDLKWFK
jgi:hypothetical protein